MIKPTPQFVQKLEQELRALYRQQHAQPEQTNGGWHKLFQLLIPVASSAFIITFLLFSFVLKNPASNQDATNMAGQSSQKVIALNQDDDGKAAEDIINDFDGDELKQIDQGITLALAN